MADSPSKPLVSVFGEFRHITDFEVIHPSNRKFFELGSEDIERLPLVPQGEFFELRLSFNLGLLVGSRSDFTLSAVETEAKELDVRVCYISNLRFLFV